jgi:acetoin utilization protein AcuB
MNTQPIQNFMSRTPVTIDESSLLSEAIKKMHETSIRHLPVELNGRLTGVLSDRDIKLALAVHPDANGLAVGDIMTDNPYTVTPNCPLHQVVREMAENRFGCALVENEQGRVVGIFTSVDALGLMAEWLRKKNLGSNHSQ